MTPSPSTVALLTLIAVAAGYDLRERRIPNTVTLPGLVVGLGLRATSGAGALADGAMGAVLALGLAVPLVVAGGLGGGDAKLLAAVGSFLGLSGLPMALLVTAVTGGVMAIVTAVRRAALGETLAHCRKIVSRALPGVRGEPLRTLATPGAIAIPYGVAIGAGALAGWWS